MLRSVDSKLRTCSPTKNHKIKREVHFVFYDSPVALISKNKLNFKNNMGRKYNDSTEKFEVATFGLYSESSSVLAWACTSKFE